MKKIFFVLPIALTILACKPFILIEPSSKDVEQGKTSYPNLTLEELKAGKKVFETNCISCHSAKRSFFESVDEVKENVPRMVKKVNKGKNIISADQEKQLLQYLLVMREAQAKAQEKK